MSRILCICEQGDNRSVHLAYLLKQRGHSAIAAGVQMDFPDLEPLAEWADKVILLDSRLSKDMMFCGNKLIIWDVGADNYPRPLNKELIVKLNEFINSQDKL